MLSILSLFPSNLIYKEQAVNGRCCQKSMVPVQLCHRRFQEWTVSKVFQKLWVRLLEVYDDIKGIRWMDVAIIA